MLDLFAGTGVGVAAQRLGIEEHGVEIMPAAVSSREAAGMTTVYRDVWDVDLLPQESYDILWASPPCQTFSVAGAGAGRNNLSAVLDAVSKGKYRGLWELRELAQEVGDERTALVLTPLLYAGLVNPTFIALEQVVEVLPVWESFRDVLEAQGFSVSTGVLDSQNYRVPQSRRRAIPVARRDGREAHLPTPTGRADLRQIRPDQEGLISNYSSRGVKSIRVPGNKLPRGFRTIDEPAFTATSKVTSQRWYPSMERVTEAEAAKIQSYPEGFPFQGTKSDIRLQIGNAVPPLLAEAILKEFIE